ncbi:hypothetical protein P167DRAFT_278314 [Morchella conica CCBAS932]|uniref:Uncharacterized protein n=1 Tax=Morchella conica CCBAS932 TaxID=1392247 RepID=A0A3N4KI18_9PEZI|nr:hypothetical protein P167DRAFT_278314 [Morchella conica CCBAS932]
MRHSRPHSLDGFPWIFSIVAYRLIIDPCPDPLPPHFKRPLRVALATSSAVSTPPLSNIYRRESRTFQNHRISAICETLARARGTQRGHDPTSPSHHHGRRRRYLFSHDVRQTRQSTRMRYAHETSLATTQPPTPLLEVFISIGWLVAGHRRPST